MHQQTYSFSDSRYPGRKHTVPTCRSIVGGFFLCERCLFWVGSSNPFPQQMLPESVFAADWNLQPSAQAPMAALKAMTPAENGGKRMHRNEEVCKIAYVNVSAKVLT